MLTAAHPCSCVRAFQRHHIALPPLSELTSHQTTLTFVVMFDPSDGLLIFSVVYLLPSGTPTLPTPMALMVETPNGPSGAPAPCPHLHLPTCHWLSTTCSMLFPLIQCPITHLHHRPAPAPAMTSPSLCACCCCPIAIMTLCGCGSDTWPLRT